MHIVLCIYKSVSHDMCIIIIIIIRYLLGSDFPGMRIGPEPTTDRFTAIMNGPDERTIPGNALGKL